MKKYVSSAVLSLLASISFGVANASPAQEVNRQIAPGTGNTASNDMTRRADEIQNLIERSEEAYRKAESFFKSGEYGQARRSYDESIDILLGSGYDVRREARLRDQYHSLIDRINQRQSQIAAMLQGPRPLVASEKDEFTDSQLAAQDKNAGKFGQRQEKGYVESPLDEVAKVNLTDEERRATDEEARAAFSAAKVDFGFRPNALVQSWINYYQGRGKATMETGLRRAGRYVSRARKIFKEEGVPQDLVWLGQVESAWLPQARSWASAVGLWQFVPATGARFGLYQDYYIDERSSFEKATRASARYLKWLANRYA